MKEFLYNMWVIVVTLCVWYGSVYSLTLAFNFLGRGFVLAILIAVLVGGFVFPETWKDETRKTP